MGIDFAASYHYSAGKGGGTGWGRGMCEPGKTYRNNGIYGEAVRAYRLFPVAKEVNFREYASDR
jgi:hypothetical protein